MAKKFLKERVIKEEMWETVDGQIFTYEKDAREHEKNYGCVIRGLFKSIPHVKTDEYELTSMGSEDSSVFVVKPRNLDDIKIINELATMLGYPSGVKANSTCVGKELLIGMGCDDDWMFYYGTVEEYLAEIQKKFSKLCAKIGVTNDESNQ